MPDNAKAGKKLRFSFKLFLAAYLVIAGVIILAIAVAWPKWTKYKQRMIKEHNAKAAQLLYGNDYSWKTTDKDLMKLKKLNYITELDFSFFMHVNDADLEHLKSLITNLTKLTFRFTGISDVGLMHLESCFSLKELYLAESNITKSGVAELKKALPNCKINLEFSWD